MKEHISINGFVTSEDFSSRSRGRNPAVPLRERNSHGVYLQQQYSQALLQYDERTSQDLNPITDDSGIYVEITGHQDCELPLESLDTSRDFKLCSCRTVNNVDIAVVFIPESRRQTFLNKIEQYLDQAKDSVSTTGVSKPRNHKLIGSIANIRLAEISSFWTDSPSDFPSNRDEEFWCELWLKKKPGENPIDIARELAERIDSQIGHTSLSFFDCIVLMIKSSINKLERSTDLIANLKELRKAKETPNVILESPPEEQTQWANNLLERLDVEPEISTSICILDSGVNYHHPLLSATTQQNFAECWEPSWPHFDSISQGYNRDPFNDHGSKQAGLAAFGDLQEAVLSHDRFSINYYIESARILPPLGENDPVLYGAITVGTASKHEIERPDWNRVFSLAVTSAPEFISGQPSSWSAGIDRFTSGIEDEYQRLFVISAGNNLNIDASLTPWDQAHLAEIEDPAQSWNAITVGAYTEKTTNDDPFFNGWSPFSESGDISPSTRTAVNWQWKKQAPYKPDVVEEGGNRLLSPNRDEVSKEDVLSLLTTSGRTAGSVFDVSADTSAASALVSRKAALILQKYPHFWPETVRGLIAHSAEWTPKMYERYNELLSSHSPKIAKETALRTVGYGVVNLEKALYSANHSLTMIAQDTIQPFVKAPNAATSSDPKLNEMQLYQLPWPIETLQLLPHDLEIKLRVSLSYFIEPNPGRKGYKTRYSYQSHGLRFEVIRPGQSLSNFRSYINGSANNDDYIGPEGETNGWFFGSQLRKRGSLHSDIWTGTAAELADMHTIAVYPVGGWWKYRAAENRWMNNVRYSLIVSIEVPDEEIDIYSTIESLIQTEILV